MKNILKIFAVILIICQMVLCFSSCGRLLSLILAEKEPDTENGFENVSDEQTEDEQSKEESAEESVTDEEQSEEATEEESTDKEQTEESFVLTKELLSLYTIVIPSKTTGEDLSAVAAILQRNIKDATGLTLEIKDDFVIEGNDAFAESEYEILLGYTNRKASQEYYRNVKINDSGYAMSGKKVLIVGYSSATAQSAVVDFKLDVLKNISDDVIMTADNEKIFGGKYTNETLLINGVDICEYTIVYPFSCVKGENDIATYIQEYVTLKTGYVIKCVDDREPVGEYEIQIGDTSRVTDEMKSERDAAGYTRDKAYIGKTENGLWIYGNGKTGFYMSMRKLMSRCEENDGSISLDLTTSVCEVSQTFDVSVMTYNVYYDLSETKRDPQGVITTVKQKAPDIFGLNESGKDWVELFLADSEITSVYECIWGKPTDSSSDAAYNVIFYRKDKFEVLESGTKWLSPTPDKKSQFAGAAHYKTFSYAVMVDKASGAEFLYINTHLDGSNNGDQQAALSDVRAKQAEVIKSFVKTYSYLPIVISGDFNEQPSSSTIKGLINNNSRLKYCLKEAKEKIDIGTTKKINSKWESVGPSIIDYIFATTDSIVVNFYEQIDNPIDGVYPSDHLPVYAEVSIKY